MPGKDHTDYYHVKFSAYAELKGERIDIAGMSVTYMLDDIPTAEIYPTVGREPVNNKEAMAVDKLLAAQPFTPIKLYAKFESSKDNPSDDPGFPYDADTLLFDGYVTGVTYKTSRNPAGGWVNLTVGAMGWLAGMRGTSAQTAKATVKGPGGFAETANLNNGKIALFNAKQAFATDGLGIVTDFWLDFIKPFFYEIAETPSVWGDTPNDSALSALGKMDNEKVFSDDATNSLPLRIAEEAKDINIVREVFGQAISNQIYTMWRGADLWSALTGLASEFQFSIVPLISTASCVPAYAALNGNAHRYITTNDYSDISIEVQTPMKIVKLVVVGSMISSSFAPTPISSGIIGLHSAESAWADPELGARGQTIVRGAPQWLCAANPIGKITRDSVGSDRLLIPDAVNPTANVKEPEVDYQTYYNNYYTSDLGDRYAKTLAQPMLFADRRGTINGRFRLDIAPGSLVKLQVIDDLFSERGAAEKALYGQVRAVGLNLTAGKDGASGTASTTFMLGSVRTATEHEAPGTALTAARHPMYEQRFVGVKLWS